ncbi:DNA-binding MarR family transcriptional regulator [Nocardiopsis sp. Huas11]|uniref:MarR family winged helix-turn-helix transcriptional regulator n=1 Tax=Nocardiopsis sp. Huas11 TaxID=2183912 RepID=UPI000F0ED439|nr:MarR family transcriptional regulator [Nocardiopsis sp. Huas11]RKS07094.1 DNA-binding MarR family transcriptional regulator [Nocardiopsis sp. Huas11]
MAERPLREHLVLLLSIAGHVSKQTQEQRLAELDLSVREQVTLTAIAEGAPTQLAIGRKAGLDKSTLTPVLDQLERKGLIDRHPDPDDRRARVVTVTDVGRRSLAGSGQAVAETEEDLLNALSPDERRQFRSLLQRVVEEGMSNRSVPGSCL